MDYLFRWLELRFLKADATAGPALPSLESIGTSGAAPVNGKGNGHGAVPANGNGHQPGFMESTSPVVAQALAAGATTHEEIERAVFQAQADCRPSRIRLGRI